MVTIIVGAISMGIVFLYGCIGEIVTEKSGHLNLGIPGIMCMGTAGGCFGVSLYMNMLSNPNSASLILLILFSVFFCVLFAGLGGLIYAVLTVTLKSNQNVVGLAITAFGAGFSQFFIDKYVNRIRFAKASKTMKSLFTFYTELGDFGKIFLSYGLLTYFAIILAVVITIFLKKSRAGLRLRSVGESPATADAVGINVDKYKYLAIIIGSAIAGLGGLYYVMEYNSGTFDNTSTIQAFGWLAVALVIFTLWNPTLSILGSFVFGALYILGPSITGNISLAFLEIIKLAPYFVTIIVLIITSIFGSKSVQPPASLGVNYFREER